MLPFSTTTNPIQLILWLPLREKMENHSGIVRENSDHLHSVRSSWLNKSREIFHYLSSANNHTRTHTHTFARGTLRVRPLFGSRERGLCRASDCYES